MAAATKRLAQWKSVRSNNPPADDAMVSGSRNLLADNAEAPCSDKDVADDEEVVVLSDEEEDV